MLRKWTSCILSKFYIKPQPRNDQPAFTQRCILSKFYIKPQHRERRGYADRVVSYRNSTSNHNSRSVLPIKPPSCILSKFYIKPQPRNDQPAFTQRCILSKFYIKPQHRERRGYADRVVSYRNSTSNHNSRSVLPIKPPVVSYRNSTSNHNRGFCHRADHEVVSYRNSTSNHNIAYTIGPRYAALYLIEILHQTTTFS